jgi:DinB family protein
MTDPLPRTGRPGPGEYAEYASQDISSVPGDDAVDALERLAGETVAQFHALAGPAARGLTHGHGKWTLKQVLGHLIDDERVFAYRLFCLARGEAGELPGFDENRYAAHAEYEARSLEALLAEYTAVRGATLALLRTLSPAAWARRGRVNGYAASVRGLAFHIAGHELHHLRAVRERYLAGPG